MTLQTLLVWTLNENKPDAKGGGDSATATISFDA
jgi:hypothetical protein